jgi:cold-inducible RNA-binding protein
MRMSSRLYVGNLAHETKDTDLRDTFAQYGEVVSARVMSDRRGRTKRFGYVEMGDEASAREAMESLRGQELNGRIMDITLEEGSRRPGRPSRPGRRR